MINTGDAYDPVNEIGRVWFYNKCWRWHRKMICIPFAG